MLLQQDGTVRSKNQYLSCERAVGIISNQTPLCKSSPLLTCAKITSSSVKLCGELGGLTQEKLAIFAAVVAVVVAAAAFVFIDYRSMTS